MIAWIKKHWKTLLVGLGFVASFVAGIFAISRSGFSVGGGGNSSAASRLQATNRKDGERVAENIGRIETTADGIERTGERLAEANQRLKTGSQRLESLADGLDKLAK